MTVESPERTLLAHLSDHATSGPTRPAIVFLKAGTVKQLTYADLDEETARWSAWWSTLALKKGSVIFLVLRHCMDAYPAFLGAMRAGLVPSFLPYPTAKQDPAHYWSAHEALLQRVQPAAILTYQDLLASLREICDPLNCMVLDLAIFTGSEDADDSPPLFSPDPEALALLQHSSGTTGLKKGVALTFESIQAQIDSYSSAIKADASDRVISWLPIYHDMGLVTSFILPITLGALLISIDPFEWLADPGMLFEEIARYQATLCWMPNFAFNHLCRTHDPNKTYDLSSIRAFVNCSEPCRPETVRYFTRCFSNSGLRPNAVQTCYGMAEMVFAATQSDCDNIPNTLLVDRLLLSEHGEVATMAGDCANSVEFLSCGHPISGVSIRIVSRSTTIICSEEGPMRAKPDRNAKAPALPTKSGEVELRASFLFKGYFNDPSSGSPISEDGWFKSGDIGFLVNGELFVCGRLKEMLIIHGRNFYANDIEEIVNRVEGIKPGRVVALGRYDPTSASEEAYIIAETLLTDEQSHKLLKEAIRQQLFACLSLSVRRVQITREGTLMKTTSGKISRGGNLKLLDLEAIA